MGQSCHSLYSSAICGAATALPEAALHFHQNFFNRSCPYYILMKGSLPEGFRAGDFLKRRKMKNKGIKDGA